MRYWIQQVILIFTAMCFCGGTLMGVVPEKGAGGKREGDFSNGEKKTFEFFFSHEGQKEFREQQKKQKQELEYQRAKTRLRQTKCLDRNSFFKEDKVEIPSSFDFNCVLALALEDYGFDMDEARELAELILLNLPDVYHEDIESSPVSFFNISEEEQQAVLAKLGVVDDELREFIQYIPATFDGRCPIDTECPEEWLNFFEYLYKETKNPFWKELYDTTEMWYQREYREGWVDAVGFPAEWFFKGEDAALAVVDKVSVDKDYLPLVVERTIGAVWFCLFVSLVNDLESNHIRFDNEMLTSAIFNDRMFFLKKLSLFLILSNIFDVTNIITDDQRDLLGLRIVWSPLVHIVSAYLLHKLLPNFDGKSYATFFPLIPEASRLWIIFQSTGNYDHLLSWRVLRVLEVMWSGYLLYTLSKFRHFFVIRRPHLG